MFHSIIYAANRLYQKFRVTRMNDYGCNSKVLLFGTFDVRIYQLITYEKRENYLNIKR